MMEISMNDSLLVCNRTTSPALSSTTYDNTTAEDSDDSLCDIAAEEEDLDAIGPFYFETPRLAFKANSDYKNFVQAIVVLKSQKAQAKRDRQQLQKLQAEALANPLLFVEKLKQNQLVFPKKQKVVQIPVIDWSKYATSENKMSFRQRQMKHLSSIKASRIKRKTHGVDESIPCIPSKFNELWSEEEQQRLDLLLIEFPPEEVEARRWEKIASALGTRTPRQVASRVQKHFIKLMKAGDPIPGRTPNPSFLKNKNRSSHTQPVHDDQSLYDTIEVSDEDDVQPELHDSSEYEELMLIKKIIKAKMQQFPR